MAVLIRSLGTVLALLLAGTGPAPAEPQTATGAAVNFIVKRDGTPIGTHRITFQTENKADGQQLIVDMMVDIKVKFVFITLYTYRLRGREVWQGERLLSFESDIDDNGTKGNVRVRAAADGLHVESKDVSYTAPADMAMASYWRADTVQRSRFIDIENGHLIELFSRPTERRPVAAADRTVGTDVYKLSGELDGEIGYTSSGEWTLFRIRTHGSDILYTRAP